jgi:hypothetical protein
MTSKLEGAARAGELVDYEHPTLRVQLGLPAPKTFDEILADIRRVLDIGISFAPPRRYSSVSILYAAGEDEDFGPAKQTAGAPLSRLTKRQRKRRLQRMARRINRHA